MAQFSRAEVVPRVLCAPPEQCFREKRRFTTQSLRILCNMFHSSFCLSLLQPGASPPPPVECLADSLIRTRLLRGNASVCRLSIGGVRRLWGSCVNPRWINAGNKHDSMLFNSHSLARAAFVAFVIAGSTINDCRVGDGPSFRTKS